MEIILFELRLVLPRETAKSEFTVEKPQGAKGRHLDHQEERENRVIREGITGKLLRAIAIQVLGFIGT